MLNSIYYNSHVIRPCLSNDTFVYEIGIDEAMRGPFFVRVYSAAVILPKDNSYEHTRMKDSKNYIQKIQETVKENIHFMINILLIR